MTEWATIRRLGAAVALVLGAVGVPTLAADPFPTSKPAPPNPLRPAKASPAELREIAEKAEKAGDWETAFNAYCHLFVSDRGSPELREKLNATLRRVQQVRRHRDPGFQQFVTGMQLGGSLDLFAEVVQKVPSVYVERDRAVAQNLWAYAIEELDRALGNPAFRQTFLDNPRSDKLEQLRLSLRRDWAKRTIADHKDARTALRQLVAAMQDAFTVRVPAVIAIECACGACSGLDEYTVFLTPQLQGADASNIPDLSAAGLYLGATRSGLVIQGVAPGSWAALHTPLRRGDRIAKVNGRTTDTGSAGAAEALRNPLDGFQQLELAPQGDGPGVVVRLPLTIPTVFGIKVVNPAGVDKIGYARIGSFATTTPRELDDALNALKINGARAIVLDLRGNHGGSFLAGVETARRLLPAGLIVTTQGQAPEVDNQVFSSSSGMSAHDIPIVLLIDAETASAAEVLAAALKDNNRATLVGMPSFGKGTVQYPLRLVTLDDDPTSKRPQKSGTVRLTIAKLIAPRGGPINGVGISPHYLEADYGEQLNVAVEKAIELLPGSMMVRPISVEPEPVAP
ncbi:S41 family peptidase [Frigoriglobus tundricola]|uniref:Carboxyl-terminal protease n=1 Tax=Frigoriglobus tundricola TaxID=2774151 RepID=A0A6M5YZR6_9BACT|nr:S41 family peptidase [Frigoriglobus tundricola]QJW99368.1 carboxyl-terminal protease [Frigoriglobus tundricola]